MGLMEKSPQGVVVPMPMYPLFCWMISWLVPIASPPVDMVEVAVVEVMSSVPVIVRLAMFRVARLADPDTRRSP